MVNSKKNATTLSRGKAETENLSTWTKCRVELKMTNKQKLLGWEKRAA